MVKDTVYRNIDNVREELIRCCRLADAIRSNSDERGIPGATHTSREPNVGGADRFVGAGTGNVKKGKI